MTTPDQLQFDNDGEATAEKNGEAEPTLSDVLAAINAQGARIGQLEDRLGGSEGAPQGDPQSAIQGAQTAQPAQPQDDRPTAKEFFDDPVGTIEKIVAKGALNTYREAGGADAADLARRTAIANFERSVREGEEGVVFDALGEQYRNAIKDLPLETLAMTHPDGESGVQKMWDYVKGKNMKVVVDKLAEQAKERSSEARSARKRVAPFTEGAHPRSSSAGASTSLDPDESDIAAKLGIAPEDYLRTKNAVEQGLQHAFGDEPATLKPITTAEGEAPVAPSKAKV